MASKYAFRVEKYEDFYKYPHKYYMTPFRIFGNLYFVGNQDVGAYLLNTSEGLILIDTTYPTTRALLIQSIWEAGFDPRNIRYILHTHGHFDHFGATDLIVSLSGAKTFLGAEDARMFRERPELALICDTRYTYLEPFKPDVELQDGDIVQLGDTRIRCVSAPGHTMGVFAYFIELQEGEQTHLAGLYGGIGVNTLCRESIARYHTEYLRNYHIASLEKVRHEPVDIVLGNHTQQANMQEKYQRMIADPSGPNPFIDPSEWQQFIDGAEALYRQMLQDEQTGADQI